MGKFGMLLSLEISHKQVYELNCSLSYYNVGGKAKNLEIFDGTLIAKNNIKEFPT